MYRDLAVSEDDRAWLLAADLRYDRTSIPPGSLCGEYVKTKGHYHPKNPAGVGYPELYQVAAGEAHFLLQRENLADVVSVAARAGQVVIVPPGYGHVTINPGPEELVIANLVSSQFTSEYRAYEALRGAAYYEFEGGRWMKNPAYHLVPPLRHVPPPDAPSLGIRHGKDIYDLVGREDRLSFLNHPEINKDAIPVP
jgi:glucose-6-phosphate isomerase